jgi:hypothetical protein
MAHARARISAVLMFIITRLMGTRLACLTGRLGAEKNP